MKKSGLILLLVLSAQIAFTQEQDSSVVEKDFIVDSLSFKMKLVEAGTFEMGCNPERDDEFFIKEKPLHSVTLKNYWVGENEVTQALYRAVTGKNPSSFKNCDQCPVENVSWEDVQEFLKKLNMLTNGMKFRLPTEAEWEFAARGGNQTKAYKYAGGNDLDSLAWLGSNSKNKTHPVGQKAANELGFYDMSGNVWEWCADWYGKYSSAAQTGPQGPAEGRTRLLRGGSWVNLPRFCRSAVRYSLAPDYGYDGLGFRLAGTLQD